MAARPGKRKGGVDPRLEAKLAEAAGLAQQGATDQAMAAVRRVLDKAPGHPEANRLASALMVVMNQPDRALFHAERAMGAEPNNGASHYRLGVALSALNRREDAMAALEKACELSPDDIEVLHAFGSVSIDLGRYAQGEAALHRVIERRPDWVDPAVTLATCELNTARASQAVERLRGITRANPGHLPAFGQLALASSYDDSLTPEQVFACHRAYGECLGRIMRVYNSHPNDPSPERRVRVGFVSSELRNHSVAYFLRPLVERIDHERFEVVMYHASRHEDAVTEAIKVHADRWVACDTLTPPALAQRIHQDRVDLLIELTGHFVRNRLPTMAARPAPVQITAIGYGNTTGVRSAFDVRIVDAHTDPEPGADRLATEPLHRLGRCFLAYGPDKHAPEPGAGEDGRAFTFGSFNDIKKLSPSVVACWSTILKACQGSRLLLKSGELGNDEMRAMVLERFAEQGIAEDRISLRGRIESDRGHLGLYDEVDLALDTFPYAGTTTTCEALWQGVPVLTLAGRAHAGRVGVSLLHACGQSEMIAPDEDAYRALACEAFGRGRRPVADRVALRERVAASELLDADGYAAEIQGLWRDLWTRWCERTSPGGGRR